MDARALKIGITCFPLVGGSGILATALGKELAARGHDIHFFSHAKPVRLDVSLPRIHFHEVAVGHATVFPCPDYTLPLAVKMAEVGRAQGLDLFHVHYAVPHATAAFLASEMIGPAAPKVVTTLHGTDTTLLGPNPQYRAAIEHALVHSDAVTTVSDSLRRQTEEIFRLPKAIEVIQNFFTPSASNKDRAEVRRELGVSDREFLALHMSNLRPSKRVDLLLRVIAASGHRDRIRLLVLAGAPFAPFEPLVTELGLRENVVVKEDAAVVEDFLPAADAGLYTSENESFGLSILETLFFAKPVVAFRIGGIPEVIGDAGFLHDFGDIRDMARSLDTLIESPELARETGERGRERAGRLFTADRIVPQYEELYRRVLAS
ncbi:MAG TPA: N-acetyl-alpha-D-glucosaminyl L-malate synthase BshA [Chthoniobacterales bacterium]|jgi:N-acetyl-alpha-D-glucosaminyl L-malate synthase BshA|nr:N-acetyl-alpha-D-glucosaminyl L-malate synthase BshA [Chthoniobacterales bacterium]